MYNMFPVLPIMDSNCILDRRSCFAQGKIPIPKNHIKTDIVYGLFESIIIIIF